MIQNECPFSVKAQYDARLVFTTAFRSTTPFIVVKPAVHSAFRTEFGQAFHFTS